MSVQTTFSQNLTAAFAGMLADQGDHDAWAMTNNESSASIPFGRAVKFGAVSGADKSAKFPTAETSVIAGIVMHSHAYSNSPNGDLDSTGLKPGAVMNVLRKGRIWVIVEDGCSVGDRLWVRAVAAGDPEFLGGINNADDSTDMVDCTNQGVFLSACSAGGLAVLEVDFTNFPTVT